MQMKQSRTAKPRDTNCEFQLIKKIPLPTFIVGGEGVVLDYNKAASDLMTEEGYPDFAGVNLFALLSEVSFFDLEANINSNITYLLELPDGTTRQMEITVETISQSTNSAGDQYLVFIRNVTASRSHHIDSLKFRSIFYNSDAMMLICSPDGIIENASAGVTRYTGRTEEELQGRSFLEFMTADTEVWLELQNALCQKLPWFGEVRSIKNDGSEGCEEMTVSPVFDSDDNLVSFSILSKDVTEERLRTKRLEQEAQRDFLTKIYNRRTFMSLAEARIESSRTCPEPIAVTMLDIDFFKKVNDTYGHDAGDEVLRRFAALISSLIREDDIFARYGGEEFILMITGAKRDIVEKVLERIRSHIESTPIEQCGQNIAITISQGACYTTEPQPLETLISRADESLYAAKQSGRNRVEFSPDSAID